MSIKYIIKTLFSGVLIGLLLALIFLVIEVLAGREFVFDQRMINEIGNYMLYSVVLTFINSVFFDYLNHRMEWKKNAKYRLLIGMGGGIVLTMLGIFFVRIITEIGFKGEAWEEFVSGEKAIFYVIALLITLVVTVFFHAVYFYKEIQRNRVKEQKIIAGTASAKFDALKNQLDPHFLFNSLNVLTSLIDENSDQAQKFTTSLSKVYRYVLEQKNKELVTVDEELKFAKVYMTLIKMRFEDSIVFESPEKSSNPEAKVVPLSLQLLLENAVKHNMVTPNKKLHIKIFEAEGNLVVQNNIQPKQVVKKGSGVGLQNIIQRYYLLTNRRVIINETAQEFAVAIPMLSKQISVMKTQEIYLKDKKYDRAREKVKKLKEFYIHFTIYLIFIPVFIGLNIFSTSFPWAIFPIAGWGLGVAGHAMETYNYTPFLGKNWEDQKIKDLMEKDNF